MPSERQIAANRRNAQKSTGPRSQSGKKRSSKNAFVHGLSVPITSASKVQVEDLSRQFAGDTTNAKILVLAEAAAEAQLDLERVRKVKAAIIDRDLMQSAANGRTSHGELVGFRHRVAENGQQRQAQQVSLLPSPEPSTHLPSNEDGGRRFVDAVRLGLLELTTICPYEKRAAGRRDSAIRELVSIKTANKKIMAAPSSKGTTP
jgi:hypothetical protein